MTKKQEVASLRKQIRDVEQKMTAIENQLDTESVNMYNQYSVKLHILCKKMGVFEVPIEKKGRLHVKVTNMETGAFVVYNTKKEALQSIDCHSSRLSCLRNGPQIYEKWKVEYDY